MIVTSVYIFNTIEVGSKKIQICIRFDRFCNSEKCLCWLPGCEELGGDLKDMMRMPLLGLLVFLSDDWRTPSELYFRMKGEVQSSIRVTPMPKLNLELPPRWRSPDSQVATASSVLYLAQSGWVMTPALLMTGSTDVQPVCSRPIVKIRNRIRISTSQRSLCVNWF